MPPARVLIVDDDPEFLRVAFRYLGAKAGFECQTAATGADAVLTAKRGNPDVVLLDLRLRGGMTGFAVMKALRAAPETAGIPVVLMTGESRAADLLDSAGAEAGAFAVLHKPFDLAMLGEILQRAVRPCVPAAADCDAIVRGELRIDLRARRVFFAGRPITLGRRTRFEVLCALARSKDGLTVPLLRALVWGSGCEHVNTVVKTVNRLRQDLRVAVGVDLIVSIPGGYKLQ